MLNYWLASSQPWLKFDSPNLNLGLKWLELDWFHLIQFELKSWYNSSQFRELNLTYTVSPRLVCIFVQKTEWSWAVVRSTKVVGSNNFWKCLCIFWPSRYWRPHNIMLSVLKRKKSLFHYTFLKLRLKGIFRCSLMFRLSVILFQVPSQFLPSSFSVIFQR